MSAPLFPADPLEVVPLFAPGCGLMPTKLAQQYVGDRLFNPLTLFIFPSGPVAESAINSTCGPSMHHPRARDCGRGDFAVALWPWHFNTSLNPQHKALD